MLPAILGLGGLTAKIIATAVIPRIVRAISYSLLTTRPAEPCSPSHVEGISTWDEPALAPQRSGVSGSLASSRKWGYAGLWHHGPSGLDLATYRAYDAANRRWISRDPLGEGVDYNLYRYCGNNPINAVDPAGLDLIYNTRQNSAEGRATLETANDRLYATVPRARQVIDGLIDSGYQVIVRSRAPETGGEGASYTPTTLRNGHWELSSKVIYIDINPKKTRKKCRSGSYPNPLVDEVLSHELEHVYQWIYNTHQTVIDSMNSPPPSNENSPIEQAPLRMNNEVIYEYRRRGL